MSAVNPIYKLIAKRFREEGVRAYANSTFACVVLTDAVGRTKNYDIGYHITYERTHRMAEKLGGGMYREELRISVPYINLDRRGLSPESVAVLERVNGAVVEYIY